MNSEEPRQAISTLSRNMNLFEKGPILFDGGMGSMLIAAGLPTGRAPEKWNQTHPANVRNVHIAYLEAGADVITTNTFGGTPGKLAGSGLKDVCNEINLTGVKLAREAILTFDGYAGGSFHEARSKPAKGETGAPPVSNTSTKSTAGENSGPSAAESAGRHEHLVALSMGPTGKMLPPVGGATEEELTIEFKIQASSVKGLVDIVIIETIFDLREGLCALRAARSTFDGPVGVTMTFDKKPRGFFTIMGDEAASATRALEEAGADFVGANCTLTSDNMIELARIIREAVSIPLLCQPNAGMPRVEGGVPIYGQEPMAFAEDILEIISLGINAVGGCCGTTPEFTRAIRKRMGNKPG